MYRCFRSGDRWQPYCDKRQGPHRCRTCSCAWPASRSRARTSRCGSARAPRTRARPLSPAPVGILLDFNSTQRYYYPNVLVLMICIISQWVVSLIYTTVCQVLSSDSVMINLPLFFCLGRQFKSKIIH